LKLCILGLPLPVLYGIPRPRAGASLKRARIRIRRMARKRYPPPAGGGLIEAAVISVICGLA